jgi:nicotinate dehydrogenase subunit A
MPTYACRINGRTASIDSWDPARPLLYSIRHTVGLSGAKPGCALGQCGTCLVLVDNQPVRSCITPTSSVAGKSITTIEGLGTPDKPDALQASFIAEQAAQCGYCTSGMILAARALLMETPRPTIEQVKQALAANLCRCGAHTRIVRAVMRASGQRI